MYTPSARPPRPLTWAPSQLSEPCSWVVLLSSSAVSAACPARCLPSLEARSLRAGPHLPLWSYQHSSLLPLGRRSVDTHPRVQQIQHLLGLSLLKRDELSPACLHPGSTDPVRDSAGLTLMNFCFSGSHWLRMVSELSWVLSCPDSNPKIYTCGGFTDFFAMLMKLMDLHFRKISKSLYQQYFS